MEDVSSLSIITLKARHNLSGRVVKACKSNGLTDIGKIMQYLSDHLTFTSLKNCGVKGHHELLDLCRYYGADVKMPDPDRPNDAVLLRNYETIRRLTEVQYDYLVHYFNTQLNQISVRTKLFVMQLLEEQNGSFAELYRNVYSSQYRFSKNYRFGKQLEMELKAFFSNVFATAVKISQEDDLENGDFFDFKTNIGLQFPIFFSRMEPEINDFRSSFFQAKFPLFTFLSFLLEHDFLKNEILTGIFLRHYQQNRDSNAGSTVRKGQPKEEPVLHAQSAEVCWKRIGAMLALIPPEKVDLSLYGVDAGDDCIYLNADLINRQDQTSFRESFFYECLGVWLPDHYLMADQQKQLHITKVHSRYLVRKSLTAYFNFVGFTRHIRVILKSGLKTGFRERFDQFLKPYFVQKPEQALRESVTAVCKLLLKREFDLVPDEAGYLNIG